MYTTYKAVARNALIWFLGVTSPTGTIPRRGASIRSGSIWTTSFFIK